MPCVERLGRCLLAATLLLAAAAESRADGIVVLDDAARVALSELPVLDGPPVALAALDDRVVVLAFFASWCPPCHPEFEHLKRIDATYGAAGVSVVAVNIFEDFGGADGGARLKAFLAGKAAAFHVVGEGERVAPLFGDVERIPTLFVFGRDGRPVLHFIHARGATKTHAGYEEIEKAVKAAL